MPFLKIAKAPVTKSSLLAGEWQDMKSDIVCKGGVCALQNGRRVKTAERAIRSYSPKDYLLSHVTIMASVDTEDGPGQVTFPDYKITPHTSFFVNNNSDAWERKLLLGTFRTFIGSENYVEHVQNPALSKGKVIDAVSREVNVFHPETNEQLFYDDGRPVTTIYIDILVATSRRFEELVESVEIGRVNAMSMGCLLKFTICSECGKVVFRDSDTCIHIQTNKGGTHTDSEGLTRITAELCGHHSDPSSCEFIEASWVSIPAFRGAVSRRVLSIDEMRVANQILKANRAAAERFHTIYKKKTASQKLEELDSRIYLLRVIDLARGS